MAVDLNSEQREIVDMLAALFRLAPAERRNQFAALVGEVYAETFAEAWPGASDDDIRANIEKLVREVVAHEREIEASSGGGGGSP